MAPWRCIYVAQSMAHACINANFYSSKKSDPPNFADKPVGDKGAGNCQNTGFSMLMIQSCLEELYIEDLAYFDNRNGRWFAESDI